MTEQTDAANLAATGNISAASTGNAAPAAKTLDTTAGTMKPAAPNAAAEAAAQAAQQKSNPAAGSTTHVDNLHDTGHIDPKTGKTFAQERAAPSFGNKGPDGKLIPASPAAKPAPASGAAVSQNKLTVNPGLSTDAGKLAQHAQVDAANEKRNAANEEGHEVNMKKAHDLAAQGQERAEKAGAPPTGKQRDENTPTILADGTKVWKA
jgi:hypothetical protein